MKIERIYISAEDSETENPVENGITDVIVAFENGTKYAASFLAYEKLEDLIEEHRQSGAYLSGKYFWMKNMLLIANLERNLVQDVIQDLIMEGDFVGVFKKL